MRPLTALGLGWAAVMYAQAPAKPAPKPVKPAAAPAKAAGTATAKPDAPKKATIADARDWIDKAETRLLALAIESGRADWIAATYIIDDSEILSAQANQRSIAATIELVKDA